MKAIVFEADGEQFIDVAEPELQPGQLMLDVAFCGICGSDLHAGEPDFHPGTVMGHEFSGVVSGIGPGVKGWSVGDRVCVNPNGGWCGTCTFCTAGEVTMCASIWDNVVGLAQNGGLASRVAVPARMVHRLPDSVSLEMGAWVEPLAVALRTVRRSEASLGDTAVVFGAGPIGLLVTMLLRAAGLSQVTVVETSPERRAKALEVGATEVLDPIQTNPVDYFADPVTAPAFAFECTGVAQVTATAVGVLRPHGRLTVTGFARNPPTYQAADLLFKEIDIRGSFIYVEEFAMAIDLLARGVVDVAPLISGIVDLSGAAEAFTNMRSSPSAVKYLIRPS
ncbi:alcohol dehydrogenase catalytic domain-containing protein [Paenarthrobacter sp. NPDC089714]|uniref:alcohol dehydrogenase catalytic domain-containing protein n=1 Tax=Paenarthrobacter sp. NPDC089714 TaxID=3364377 RepID=UPI003822AE14